MKRASITVPRDLQAGLQAYLRAQEVAPSLTAVVQAALREYLLARGYLPPARPFSVTPAKKGSGRSDVSLEHDRYFAEP